MMKRRGKPHRASFLASITASESGKPPFSASNSQKDIDSAVQLENNPPNLYISQGAGPSVVFVSE